MFTDAGKVFEEVDSGLFVGGIPVNLPTKPAGLRWTGTKMPWSLYCEIIAFFRWTYEDTKSEAQCRLAYNEKHKTWMVVVLPQEKGTGLSTKELDNHPEKKEIVEAMYLAGYEFIGTFHHHCALAAFQSGTDLSDEKNQTGLHVTVGKINEKVLDLHSRLVFRGHQYATDLVDWIDMPLSLSASAIPKHLCERIMEHYLKEPDAVAFPEVWKSRMIESKPVYHYSGKVGFHQSYQHNASKVYGTSVPDLVEANAGLFAIRRCITEGKCSFYDEVGSLPPSHIKAYNDLLVLMAEHDMSTKELTDAADLFTGIEDEFYELEEQAELEKSTQTGSEVVTRSVEEWYDAVE